MQTVLIVFDKNANVRSIRSTFALAQKSSPKFINLDCKDCTKKILSTEGYVIFASTQPKKTKKVFNSIPDDKQKNIVYLNQNNQDIILPKAMQLWSWNEVMAIT